MHNKLLFPHQYRLLGWIILMPALVLGLAGLYGEFTVSWLNLKGPPFSGLVGGNTNNLTDELATIGVIAGLLLIAFTRERIEDEMISVLRLEALQWGIFAHYLILIVTVITVYGLPFFTVMIYNLFTVLVIFILRFRWLLYRHRRLTPMA